MVCNTYDVINLVCDIQWLMYISKKYHVGFQLKFLTEISKTNELYNTSVKISLFLFLVIKIKKFDSWMAICEIYSIYLSALQETLKLTETFFFLYGTLKLTVALFFTRKKENQTQKEEKKKKVLILHISLKLPQEESSMCWSIMDLGFSYPL